MTDFTISEVKECHVFEDEKFCDYDCISDENFILLLILTTNSNIIAYHKTENSLRIEKVSFESLLPDEKLQPILISITSDASLVVILGDCSSIVLSPFSSIMDVSWGRHNQVVITPTKFELKTDFAFPNSLKFDQNTPARPTSSICLTSEATKRPYLIFGNQLGVIHVVDLYSRSISLCGNVIPGKQCTIERLDSFVEKDGSKLILITYADYSQRFLKIEYSGVSIWETLSHNLPDHVFNVESGKRYFISNNFICELNISTSQIKVLDSFLYGTSLSIVLDAPTDTNCICYESNQTVYATHSNKLFVNLNFLAGIPNASTLICAEDYIREIMFLIASKSSGSVQDLSSILIISSFGVYWLHSKKSVSLYITDYLYTSNFSSNEFSHIALNLKIKSSDLIESILESILKSQCHETFKLDGLISIAFDFDTDFNKLYSLLLVSGREDLLLPYLTLRFETNPATFANSQLLFNAYISKLKKVTHSQQNKNLYDDNKAANYDYWNQKDTLESGLKQFLIKFEPPSDIIPFFVDQSMWSCLSVALFKNAEKFSNAAARIISSYISDWEKIPKFSEFVTCLSFLHWESAEPYMPSILDHLTNLIPGLQSTLLKSILGFTYSAELRAPEAILPLRVIATIFLLNRLKLQKNVRSHQLRKFSSGSNCTCAIVSENEFAFWGEFSPGIIRIKEENFGSRQIKKVINKRSKQKMADGFNSIRVPKLIQLETPSTGNNSTVKISSIDCGTEHVIILTDDGSIFSWGRNRYGQCGIGCCDELYKPTLIKGSWGPVTTIYCGHYHSSFITDSNEVWLWGWGLFGQLGHNDSKDLYVPTKNIFLSEQFIISISLGHSHSIFLTQKGNVYGCGGMTYGQLGTDPDENDIYKGAKKVLFPILLPLSSPIRSISSQFMHGIAVDRAGHQVFEWGENPQSIKMKLYLMKQLKKNCNPDDSTKCAKQLLTPRDYFCIRKMTYWEGTPIKQVSAGYNHSAFITEDGHLYTWGKSLDMQLGHGTKRDKSEPAMVTQPNGSKWVAVDCSRNFTTALASNGRIYTWGRNDKNQLGLGLSRKQQNTVRRMVMNARRDKSQTLNLPPDNCVEAPSQVPTIYISPYLDVTTEELELKLNHAMSNSLTQTDINSISKFIAKNPINSFNAVKIHLSSGDILSAAEALINIYQSSKSLNCAITEEQITQTISSIKYKESTTRLNSNLSTKAKTERHANVKLRGKIRSFTHTNRAPSSDTLQNPEDENDAIPFYHPVSNPGTDIEMKSFDELLDKLWDLIRIYPAREPQTVVLIQMLSASLPIFNRVSADQLFCRLIEPFVGIKNESSFSNSSPPQTSSKGQKFSEKGIRERYSTLRRTSFINICNLARWRVLQEKCKQITSERKYYFYSNCGHFEKKVSEVEQTKSEISYNRNRLRKCTKCIRDSLKTSNS